MTTYFIFLLAGVYLLQGLLALPPPTPIKLNPTFTNNTCASVSVKTYIDLFASTTVRGRRTTLRSRYVYQNGQISTTDHGGSRIQVMATQSVSDTAHRLGATTIYRMIRYMSTSLFHAIASKVRIGIFTRAESEIVYLPNLAHPAGCAPTDCHGSCSHGCTTDGRLYSDLAGSGGPLTTILDDNILCNANDPYFQKTNILVHEFAHAIMNNGITSDQRLRITNAYHAAQAARTWSWYYPMSNEQEYWAVATATFYNSEKQAINDMDICSGQHCWSEAAARYNLYQKDQALYNLLVEIYNNNQNHEGNIGPCTQ